MVSEAELTKAKLFCTAEFAPVAAADALDPDAIACSASCAAIVVQPVTWATGFDPAETDGRNADRVSPLGIDTLCPVTVSV